VPRYYVEYSVRRRVACLCGLTGIASNRTVDRSAVGGPGSCRYVCRSEWGSVTQQLQENGRSRGFRATRRGGCCRWQRPSWRVGSGRRVMASPARRCRRGNSGWQRQGWGLDVAISARRPQRVSRSTFCRDAIRPMLQVCCPVTPFCEQKLRAVSQVNEHARGAARSTRLPCT
jgi:hypothetical protein